MKRSLLAALLLAAACSSPERRIERNKALYNTFPPPAQEKIKKGEIDIGFTPDMVLVALGKPSRKYSRKTAETEQEVWVYGEGGGARPSLGFGLGIGSGYYGSNVYTGGVHVGAGSNEWAAEERLRAVFEKGLVVSIEKRQTP